MRSYTTPEGLSRALGEAVSPMARQASFPMGAASTDSLTEGLAPTIATPPRGTPPRPPSAHIPQQSGTLSGSLCGGHDVDLFSAPPGRPNFDMLRGRDPGGRWPHDCCDVVASAAAFAARAAVAAAFSDLEPALLAAVSRAAAFHSRHGSHTSHGTRFEDRAEELFLGASRGGGAAAQSSTTATAPSSANAAADSSTAQITIRGAWLRTRMKKRDGPGHLSPRITPTHVGAKHSDSASEFGFASEYSHMSVDSRSQLSQASAVQRVPAATVQSLQAGVAQAVLEQAGFVRDSYRGSVRSQQREDPDRKSLGRVSVVPHSCERDLVERQGSTAVPGAQKKVGLGKVARRLATMRRQRTATFPMESSPEEQHEDLGTSSEPDESEAPRKSELPMVGAITERALGRTSGQVLKARITSLVQEAQMNASPAQGDIQGMDIAYSTPPTRMVPLVFLVLGVLPWSWTTRPAVCKAYQWAIRIGIMCVVASSLVPHFPELEQLPFIGAGRSECRTRGCWSLSELSFQAGAFFSLLPFALERHQRQLEDVFLLMQNVSRSRGFLLWRDRRVKFDKALFAVTWLCIVSLEVASGFLLQMEPSIVRSSMYTAIFSGVVLSAAYGMVVVCRSLTVMIDAFCCDIVTRSSVELREVGQTWNLTQAVLRQASNAIENCLLMLCLVLAGTVPLVLMDLGGQGSAAPHSRLISGPYAQLLVSGGILYVLFLASTISEQCGRVPALVNALDFGPGTERARQHTVDYITSSAAGFYVFGSRLTTVMVVKLVYVLCIVVLGVVTKLHPPGAP